MPDYSKAKIYRVYCGEDEYIGSTTRPLSERMNEHRCAFKKQTKSYMTNKIFEKHGVENCKIELIEDYPCERKEQLNRREGEIQRGRTCVNYQTAGQTQKEYYASTREKWLEYHKEYYLKNKKSNPL